MRLQTGTCCAHHKRRPQGVGQRARALVANGIYCEVQLLQRPVGLLFGQAYAVSWVLTTGCDMNVALSHIHESAMMSHR